LRDTISNESVVSSTTMGGRSALDRSCRRRAEGGQCGEIDVGAALAVTARDARRDGDIERTDEFAGIGRLVGQAGDGASTNDRALDRLIGHEHGGGDACVLFASQLGAVVEHRDRRGDEQDDTADQRTEAEQSHERSSAPQCSNLRKF
jgi:hypothetical protein